MHSQENRDIRGGSLCLQVYTHEGPVVSPRYPVVLATVDNPRGPLSGDVRGQRSSHWIKSSSNFVQLVKIVKRTRKEQI